MTDPVRPVAPREDFEPTQADLADPLFEVIWQGIKRHDVPNESRDLWSGATGNDVMMILRPLRERLAAAPVPCAASPADPLLVALRELTEACEADFTSVDTDTFGEDESVGGGMEGDCAVTFGMIRRARAVLDNLSPTDAEEHDPLCSEGTFAGDQRMPCDCHLSRATGEGATDAVMGLPAVPVPPVAPVEELAAVAVALDPHRLLDVASSVVQLWQRVLVPVGAPGVHPFQRAIAELDFELARLRGEATVRPVDWRADYDEAKGYLSRMFLHCAPQCTLLPTLAGIATQIDNYIAGLREKANEKPSAHVPATVRVEEWVGKMSIGHGLTYLECPCCGDDGAASDGEGCFYDGQALICGCPGWVSVDADGSDDPWINNGDAPCPRCGDPASLEDQPR